MGYALPTETMMTDAPDNDISFDRAPPAGELSRLSPLVRRVVAANPGPFTFTGTCSYIIGKDHVAIIDPGPDNDAHVAALLAAVHGETVDFIVVTHTHRDHSPAARAVKDATGAKIVGCRPHVPHPETLAAPREASHDMTYAPDHVMADGEGLAGEGFELVAVATPGHASNHLCFALPRERVLFSGDHVMAWSTSVISPPDGSMADYMASLAKLRQRDDTLYWPGHGGPVTEPHRYVRALELHRRHREAAILARLAAGDRTIAAIVERLYVGLDPRLKGGAARSVLAHLQDLVARGLVSAEGPPTLDAEYRPAG
jgi:glyoxylase-like metal-dependent hydrolase (beta-lactamase superfamily II)